MPKFEAPLQEPHYDEQGTLAEVWWAFYESLARGISGILPSVPVTDLTAERLVATDSTKKLVSVVTLTSWISGTADEIEVTDNGDGTITIGLPNDVIITNDLTVGNDATIDGDTYLKKDQRLYFDNN